MPPERKCPIALTDKAIEKAKHFIALDYPDGGFLRVGVSGGGCGGFSWVLDAVKEKKTNDFLFDIQGLQVIVDPISFAYLKGTKIDFIEKSMQSGFTFDTPNTRKCGCGSSFSPC